ncbi:RNA-directed DNA polymerase, eukaryota, partial [Tanacetum coccineum]
YAPQELAEKKSLWDYLQLVTSNWNGEVIILGDFNEVCNKDERPILMREVMYDYGPVPFRFFHYWFEIEGFDKFVEDAWKEATIKDSNDMSRMNLKRLMIRLGGFI